ncbi:uncharacterized protein A4U43_UnF5610 [Asparagus officinalis]|uniref:Uncharacterized protein n=1 Tax=Asparagus officinalis TaxID=4686 RepID=A0A1R3L6N3_ASPOF|nr:uncharacterized protein A4U43_UnF5610 [Asparagus officinalis]
MPVLLLPLPYGFVPAHAAAGRCVSATAACPSSPPALPARPRRHRSRSRAAVWPPAATAAARRRRVPSRCVRRSPAVRCVPPLVVVRGAPLSDWQTLGRRPQPRRPPSPRGCWPPARPPLRALAPVGVHAELIPATLDRQGSIWRRSTIGSVEEDNELGRSGSRRSWVVDVGGQGESEMMKAVLRSGQGVDMAGGELRGVVGAR